MFNIIGADMAADMMDSHQRNSGGKADCLRLGHPHQKRPHQTRPVRNRNGSDIGKRHICLAQRLLDHLIDFFDMLSGCNFRHNASILCMQCNLGKNNI